GYVEGPRIFSAGPAIGTTGGHADHTDGLQLELQRLIATPDIVDGADGARRVVRAHYKNGVNVIKIMTTGGVLDLSASGDNAQMTLDEIKAVVETAHDYGLKVAVHAHGDEGIRRAVLGGVDSIEHGTYLSDETMALMKERGTYLVPTIIAGKYVAEKAKQEGYFLPQVRVKALAIGPLIQATFARAYKAGVKIAFGTDTGVSPHGQNAQEFVYMVEAGMPPIKALQAATIDAARLLGADKNLGSVEAGKFADIVAVSGDPLADIGIMRNVAFVMKAGIVYKN
ncbi:MAG TPA: amidohydrolase family protein, partial [Opitutaceae bacterium]|nr:amidohydrolase family protein [Opitutaceae bacterium]